MLKKSIISVLFFFFSLNCFANVGNTNMINTKDNAVQQEAAFLAKNKQEKGVVTLDSGLQYKIIQEGTGPKPTLTDTVTVDYEGTLQNGKVFDSSYKRGQPATFPVAGVIAGWTQALQLMPVGSTWMLYIPASLAYGKQGAPGAIGPNEMLIFKVHLISIAPK